MVLLPRHGHRRYTKNREIPSITTCSCCCRCCRHCTCSLVSDTTFKVASPCLHLPGPTVEALAHTNHHHRQSGDGSGLETSSCGVWHQNWWCCVSPSELELLSRHTQEALLQRPSLGYPIDVPGGREAPTCCGQCFA